MFEFHFSTAVENKKELKEELKQLLRQIDSTWPVDVYNEEAWVKSKTDQEWIKLNGGYRRQSLNHLNAKK